MTLRLSYPLLRSTPLYPGTPPVSRDMIKSIHEGDSSNVSAFTLSAHSGTHLDAPRHFCLDGPMLEELITNERTYSPSYCIDIPKSAGECITPVDFAGKIGNLVSCRCLMIRTGWHQKRETSPELYTGNPPWIHPDLPGFFREKMPSLCLFGTDCISVSSPKHRDEGRASHRAFLCEPQPILLCEDMDLSSPLLAEGAWKITLYPFFADSDDASPVLVLAKRINVQ